MNPPYSLTQLPVQPLLDEQLEQFTYESIHAEKIADFDVDSITATLREKEGQLVIGADFGGDKGSTRLFIVRDGALMIDDRYEDYVQGDLGQGYLASLEKTAAFAAERNIPVGISWGAPLSGSRPLFHPKATVLLDELEAQYGGDFGNIFSGSSVTINDGTAGLISGIFGAARQAPVSSVLFQINGGGLGMAVLKDGALFSTEAGHVEGVTALNTYGQTDACGVFGAQYVCVERLGANKAGIEAQWETRHGYKRAIDIEQEFKDGNQFAGELYGHSAFAVAHVIAGTARAFGIDLGDATTAIVGHGGAFKFPDYDARIQQILAQDTGKLPRLITTFSYVDPRANACIEGAALAAIAGLSTGSSQ